MKKRILMVLLVMAVVLSSAFADGEVSIGSTYLTIDPIMIGSTEDTKITMINPFAAAWQFYLVVIVAVLGGSLMLLRLAAEIVQAVIYNEDRGEIKQQIMKFMVHVGVALFGFGIFAIIF